MPSDPKTDQKKQVILHRRDILQRIETKMWGKSIPIIIGDYAYDTENKYYRLKDELVIINHLNQLDTLELINILLNIND